MHPDKPTVDLRRGHELEAIARLRRLMIERQELLEALASQKCMACRGILGKPKPNDEPCECDDARAAIAKAIKP